MPDFNLEQILTWLIPDPDDCRKAAEELRLEDPNAMPEEHARKAVRQARKWAASIGGATGLAASPLTMLPAAVADSAAMLKLEGKLAGTVAALLDPPSLADREAFRRDIIRAVFPGAVSQALRKIGVRAGEQATKQLVARLVGREAGKELGERAAKFLGIRLTEKALATKTVPLVGAAIGAGWNWLEIQAVGNRAVDYHLGIEAPERRLRKKVVSFVRDARKKLPRPRRKSAE
ncbi:MAG TPA: hypothetical protein VER17_05905 [Tepidisphaeraceae bacterium]|nr:hypothetical protein [Tepidisphaeraceae bacterium]